MTPEEWRTYLVEAPGHEETKRVFFPGYEGATHVKLYLMRNDLIPPYLPGSFNGLSLIPISPNGFVLTLENASSVAEVRYMLLDVKPGFLSEGILREDEVKKLFHIDGELEPEEIPPGYEVRLIKEEVVNQSEIVTVSDDLYEYLKYNGWEDHEYRYEDIGVKRWDPDKAATEVSHDKEIELIYHPLACKGDGLVNGILVKNYASWDIVYELEVHQGPMADFSPNKGSIDVSAYGSVPLSLIQLESASFPIFVHLKYRGRVVASLWVHAGDRVPWFWRGFWDGVREKLPGIIVTATVLVMLAVPTQGGSLLAYVKGLMASAVIPSLMVIGVASNVKEIFEAYSTYTRINEVAEELGVFSQRAAHAGYLGAYSLFRKLKDEIEEKRRYVVLNTALDLLADVTIRDVLMAFGKEGVGNTRGAGLWGGWWGAALSLTTYAGTYYRFLSDGPRLLSRVGQLKGFLKGIYNWITPPLWDVGILAGKLTAKGIASSLAICKEDDVFEQRLNELRDDEVSLSSLVEFTGKFYDEALGISSELGLSEEAFLGLLRAYGKCGLDEEAWDKFIEGIEDIGGKSKRCADELLHSIFNAEGDEVERTVLEVAPRLAELSPEELDSLGKVLASGVRIGEIRIMLEKPGWLGELLVGIKEFDFEEPKKVTLNMGKDCSLHMGEGNELKPGTTWLRFIGNVVRRAG